MGDVLPLPWLICGMPGALQSCEGAAALRATAHCAMCRASDSALAVEPRCCAAVVPDALHMHARHVKGEQYRTGLMSSSPPARSLNTPIPQAAREHTLSGHGRAVLMCDCDHSCAARSRAWRFRDYLCVSIGVQKPRSTQGQASCT